MSPFFTVEDLSQRSVHSGLITAGTDLNVTNVYLEIKFRQLFEGALELAVSRISYVGPDLEHRIRVPLLVGLRIALDHIAHGSFIHGLCRGQVRLGYGRGRRRHWLIQCRRSLSGLRSLART